MGAAAMTTTLSLARAAAQNVYKALGPRLHRRAALLSPLLSVPQAIQRLDNVRHRRNFLSPRLFRAQQVQAPDRIQYRRFILPVR